MKFTFLLFLTFFCSVSSFAQTADPQSFRSLLKKMTDAQTAYDAAALDRILSSDFIEVSPVGEFDSRDKVLGFYTPKTKADAGNVSASLEVSDLSIRIYDQFAIGISKFTYSITADGKALPPRSMRVTTVFRKEKGNWKIASAQYTSIRWQNPSSVQSVDMIRSNMLSRFSRISVIFGITSSVTKVGGRVNGSI